MENEKIGTKRKEREEKESKGTICDICHSAVIYFINLYCDLYSYREILSGIDRDNLKGSEDKYEQVQLQKSLFYCCLKEAFWT